MANTVDDLYQLALQLLAEPLSAEKEYAFPAAIEDFITFREFDFLAPEAPARNATPNVLENPIPERTRGRLSEPLRPRPVPPPRLRKTLRERRRQLGLQLIFERERRRQRKL